MSELPMSIYKAAARIGFHAAKLRIEEIGLFQGLTNPAQKPGALGAGTAVMNQNSRSAEAPDISAGLFFRVLFLWLFDKRFHFALALPFVQFHLTVAGPLFSTHMHAGEHKNKEGFPSSFVFQ